MRALLAATAVIVAVSAGCGGDGDTATGDATAPRATQRTLPCPDDPGREPSADAATDVTATLTEYGIKLEPASVPSGTVRFDVVNAGHEGHELLLLASGDAGALPTDAAGGLDRARLDPGVLVAVLPLVGPGAACPLTALVEPGPYLAVCSLTNAESGANHFPAGMLATLEVTGRETG